MWNEMIAQLVLDYRWGGPWGTLCFILAGVAGAFTLAIYPLHWIHLFELWLTAKLSPKED